MNPGISKQRTYASLMMFGACILLYRTISMMLFESAFEILILWVILLLIAEFIIDLGCFAASARWFKSNNKSKARLALRLGATAAIIHAIRGLIYVLGRIGPWINFDVKPEYHANYTFEWFWVYFAAILSLLGVLGVVLIWILIRRKRKHNTIISNKE
jgi:hypothetical protein